MVYSCEGKERKVSVHLDQEQRVQGIARTGAVQVDWKIWQEETDTPHTPTTKHTYTHTHTHTGSECPISRVSNDAHAFLDAWFTVVQQLWRFMVIWSIRHPVTRGEAANANGIEWRWRWRWSGPGLVGCRLRAHWAAQASCFWLQLPFAGYAAQSLPLR
jgi:hypothetical protein